MTPESRFGFVGRVTAAVAWLVAYAIPQDAPAARAAERDVYASFAGQLFVCGGGGLPASVVEAFVAAGGAGDGTLIVLPAASADADAADRDQVFGQPWRDDGFGAVTVLHHAERDDEALAAVAAGIDGASAVWLSGGRQDRIARAYAGTRVEAALRALLERGGVVGGTSAGAACMSRTMIAGGRVPPRLDTGLGLLAGVVVDQHFSERDRLPRLRRTIADHPQLVGLGVDERTALVVERRTARVLGDGGVTACLAAGAGRGAVDERFAAGSRIDLPTLRRAARVRADDVPFPPAVRRRPEVVSGSVLLAGGGALPDEVLERFVKLATPDEDSDGPFIVIVPTASGRVTLGGSGRLSKAFERLGAGRVEVLHTRDRSASDDAAWCAVLEEATGVWFSGGRQWRLVDAYADTATERAFVAVLERGGVIGGSSAGTSIQGEYMVRGHPLGNQVMMAEGYERGFGFLPGVGVDQHFTQRNRQPDLEALVTRYPQVLGIGIDEGTALVVRGTTGDVIGRHGVTVLDGTRAADAAKRVQVVRAGQRIDLATLDVR